LGLGSKIRPTQNDGRYVGESTLHESLGEITIEIPSPAGKLFAQTDTER
jgi:hypothetical protein